jgi:hypothetical protein
MSRLADQAGQAAPSSDFLGGLAIEELRSKLTVSVSGLATKLGCSTDVIYESIANGTYPWTVLHIGRRILLPTAPIIRDLLGREDERATAPDE